MSHVRLLAMVSRQGNPTDDTARKAKKMGDGVTSSVNAPANQTAGHGRASSPADTAAQSEFGKALKQEVTSSQTAPETSSPTAINTQKDAASTQGASNTQDTKQGGRKPQRQGNFGDVNRHGSQGRRGQNTPGALQSEHLDPIAVQRENMRNPATGRSPIPDGRGSAIDRAQPTVMLDESTAKAKTALDRPVIAGAKNATPGIANEFGPEAGLARAEAAARANGTTVPIGARAAAIGQTDAKYADPAIRAFAREPVNNPLLTATDSEIARAVDIPLDSNTQTVDDLTSLAATNDPRAKTLFKGQYSEVAPANSQASLTQAAKTEQAATTVAQGANAESTLSQAAKLEQAASKGAQVVKAESTAAKVLAPAANVLESVAPVLKVIGKVAGPVGGVLSAHMLGEDIAKGDIAAAVSDGAGTVAGGLEMFAIASSALGGGGAATGAAAFAAEAAPVVAAAGVGVAIGTYINNHTKISDTAVSAGTWVEQHTGGSVIAGATAAAATSMLTAPYYAHVAAVDAGVAAVDYAKDNLTVNPSEIDWDRTVKPWKWF
jgi:hypothetical protein